MKAQSACAACWLALAACSTSSGGPAAHDAGGDTTVGSDTGSQDDGGGGDAEAEAAIDSGPSCSGAPGGPSTTTPLFPAGARVSGVSGSADYQKITSTMSLPAACYASASLQLKLTSGCVGAAPPGQSWPAGCDPYDRLVQLTIDDAPTPILLLDAVTPFGADVTWQVDVTDYQRSFTGSHSLSLAITTYADPTGQQSGTNAGFGVDAELTLTPGAPARDVVGIVPLFAQRIDLTTVGALTAPLVAPAGAAHGRLDFYATGHGAVGPQSCDEFCMKTNTVSFDGANLYDGAPWVSCANDCTHQLLDGGSVTCGGQTFDYICEQNPTACPPSPVASRANWCPSKLVVPFQLAIPDSATTGSHTVGLSVTNVQGYFLVGLAGVFWR